MYWYYIFFFCLPFFLLSPIYAIGGVSQGEIDALNTIYEKMGGHYWRKKTHWRDNGDPCSTRQPWYGISCYRTGNLGDFVMQIDLSHNNLTGHLPDVFDQFSDQFKYLYMQGNSKMSGSIPETLWSCVKMQKLILADIGLTGHINAKIGLMEDLTFLDLSQNRLEGNIPDELWTLTNLEYLSLRLNKQYLPNKKDPVGGLRGTIPKNIGNMLRLKMLGLDFNHITGEIPEELWRLWYIKEMYIGNNDLTGTLSESVGNLNSLNILSISTTKLEGQIPEAVYFLTQLTYLDLSKNHFTGPLSPSIGSLRNLENLNLESRQVPGDDKWKFSGPLVSQLFTLTTLKYLYLGYNDFSGTMPKDISFMRNLHTLELQSNKFVGTLFPEIFELPNLRVLRLNNNKFKGTLSFLEEDFNGTFHEFDAIALSNNYFYGDIPPILKILSAGADVLSKNLFFCPVPDWAKRQKGTVKAEERNIFQADCVSWHIDQISPPMAYKTGATLQIKGKNFLPGIENLWCKFTPTSSPISLSGNITQTDPYSYAVVERQNELYCDAPPHNTIDDTHITLFYKKSKELSNQLRFTYYTNASIDSIQPSSIRQQGEETITIRGQDFANIGKIQCLFGKNITSNAKYINTSMVTCIAPSNIPSKTTIRVSNDQVGFGSSLQFEYYSYCDGPLETMCTDHGICDNITEGIPFCVCDSGFNGSVCNKCNRYLYGPRCMVCPYCVNGVCNQGIEGDGKCSCELGWMGALCDVYWPTYLGWIGGPVFGVCIIFCCVCYFKRKRNKTDGMTKMPKPTLHAPLLLSQGTVSTEVDYN